jgi:hypothetical protein
MTERKAHTVPEAARIWGVGTDAVRKRVARGTIESELIGDRRYVYLPDTGHDEGRDKGHDTASTALVEELRDRVRSLERMLAEEQQARTEEQRRHDTLMAQLMQRIPELEPAEGSPGAPEPATEEAARPAATGGAPEGARRPWWRRVFAG